MNQQPFLKASTNMSDGAALVDTFCNCEQLLKKKILSETRKSYFRRSAGVSTTALL